MAAIPLQAGPQQSGAVQAFFENLLPEGELRVYLSGQRKDSPLFAMLLEVAGDTAGGFVLLAFLRRLCLRLCELAGMQPYWRWMLRELVFIGFNGPANTTTGDCLKTNNSGPTQ